jgi:hypothetical protein
MARTLNSPVADTRTEFVYLYEINHSAGVLRLTNASSDIVALTYTWTAVGGSLLHGSVADSSDSRAQGVSLSLYGVDQAIISIIQNNQFRGRVVKIYLIHFNPDTGAVYTPDLIFRGRQNGNYEVTEDRTPEDTTSGGSVTVTTRISADLSAVNTKRPCKCNVHSHEEFLRRSGVSSPDDKFFERVPTIMDKVVLWGAYPPEPYVPWVPHPGFDEEDEEWW